LAVTVKDFRRRANSSDHGGMDLEELRERALAVARLYDGYNAAAGREPWGTGDYALGFVGDVGDLAKLVMAAEGRRDDVDGTRERLGHELADCLWSVLVLADRCGVDLEGAFVGMTGELTEHLAPRQP
jgi:NTP pyrophosphatase (non-canonical NTP hydrolase)